MSIPEAFSFIESIKHDLAIELKIELLKRLSPLIDIGLSYLTLSRSMTSISGGESQRIKIAKYINSSLTDVVYVLDEPSVGLHYHDIHILKESILKLRDRGNTILMVEHHPEIIKMADNIVDMGPGAGIHGGEIVYQGSFEGLLKSKTLTGKMLKEKSFYKINPRQVKKWVHLYNVSKNNIQNLTIDIPLNVMTVIVGVAGSGKSSLMSIFTSVYEKEIVYVTQKSIGANSRSTPATYMDISDKIRDIFSKIHNVSASYFSFNSKGGCVVCGGKGIIQTEMGFMNTLETECTSCNGRRYNLDVLSYTYKGLNIADVFDMTVEEALKFFEESIIHEKLLDLKKVGLEYINLNQSMNTLSGGELQRVKLASHLNKKGVVYLLDEPTDGLHKNDVKKLITLFDSMVDQGNTLLIVDHHLDMMKSADYLIELGPKGGFEGGNLLYSGQAIGISKEVKSITKKYLK